MSWLIKKDDAYPITVTVIDSDANGVAGLTLTTLFKWNKNGTQSNAAGTLSAHMGNGDYLYTPTSGEVDALGTCGLSMNDTTNGYRLVGGGVQVIAIDPRDATRAGLAALPNADAGTNGGLPLGDAAGRVTVGALAAGIATAIANEVEAQIIDETDSEKVLEAIVNKINAMTDLDALTLAAIASVVTTEIERVGGMLKAVKDKTDNLPAAPATEATAAAAKTAAESADTKASAIKSQTDKLVFDGSNRVAADAKVLPSPAPSGYGPGSFSGANAVTINVKYLTTNISGATVTITQGIIVDTKTTDASGNASFSLDNGNYTLAIVKSGYSFTPETITVSAAATLNKTITAVSSPAPAQPDVCRVYDTAKNASGAAASGVVYKWRIIDGESRVYPGNTYTATSSGTGTNNIYFDVAQGSKVAVKRGAGLRGRDDKGEVIIDIPATSTAQLEDLIERAVVGLDE